MQTGTTIYLDYQASTPLEHEVIEVMQSYNNTAFANPHATAHILGKQAADDIESAKATIEQCLSALPDELIFTSGATESNNQAIASVLFSNNGDRKKVLISAIEHKCIKNAAYFFAEKLGYQVEEIPVLESGLIDIDAYKNLLSDQVVLVCIMAVNNEIGTVQDIPTLTKLSHEYGALFHCDAAQAPEAIDIDVKQWDVDMLSLSGHKIYGPKGIGALYIKNALQAKLPPLIQGGGQQFGMRSGTLAPALCIGFAKAMTLSKQKSQKSRTQLVKLKQRFIEQLNNENISFKINGDANNSHPGNLNIQFIGQDANALLESLQPNVCASTGSACNSDMILISHVLKAIGLTDEQALSSLRFSFGRFSDVKQIDSAVQFIKQELNEI